MDVVLLGPPGAGKGTQAVALAARLGLCHVSSGDLFRQTVASGGELGRRIAAIMERGDLVPDEITVRMVVDRLGRPVCAGGAILDGFPRTVEQSEALERELRLLDRRLGAAILIDVPEETLVRRLSGRWISRKTGRVFNVATFGQSLEQLRAGLAPDDELYQRPDDMPETARRRIEVYRRETCPLVEHYRRLGMLREVDGAGSVEQVQAALVAAIEALEPPAPRRLAATTARTDG